MENNLSELSSNYGASEKDSAISEGKSVMKTETWMSSLPSSLQNLPLTELTIPGTHNSGTFSCCTTLAPDADSAIKKLTEIPIMGCFIESVIHRWAQCQRLTFTQQLLSGVRYFDLRVSTKPDSDEFFLVHTLYATKVSQLIEDVKSFLDSYSQEVVILDFNHFYAMEEEHHVQLITYLIAEFGNKICHNCDIADLTLSTLWGKGHQVIIFYQHKAVESFEEIWPKQRIYNFWPNTDNPETCIARLDTFFNAKDPHPDIKDFIVCQGVLTPTATTVTQSVFGTGGLETLSEKLLPGFSAWIEKSLEFTHPLNIVTVDFAENRGFILKVIDLNYERISCK
ncbi:hypothetical protein BsWGS_13802 [Bradybaena similaris]